MCFEVKLCKQQLRGRPGESLMGCPARQSENISENIVYLQSFVVYTDIAAKKKNMHVPESGTLGKPWASHGPF